MGIDIFCVFIGIYFFYLLYKVVEIVVFMVVIVIVNVLLIVRIKCVIYGLEIVLCVNLDG